MSKEQKVCPTSKRLGEYLECDRLAIESALAMQVRPPPGEQRRRLGELLIELQAIDLPTLLEAVQTQRVDRLAACALFSSLTRRELEDLSAVFQEVTAREGEQIITQDENDPCLYVLSSGTLKVLRVNETDGEIPLARVFPGEPVGEMGYFSEGVRSASVRALERCELLRANYDDLTDCFESVPAVASAFMDVVTQRLRKTNVLFQENRPEQQARGATAALAHLGGFLEPAELDALEDREDELFERLVHVASSLTDADRASLFLIDEESGELWSKVAQEAELKEIRVPLSSGVVGWTVTHNVLVNVEDAYEDERFNRDVDRRTGYRTNTILCAPVRDRDRRVIGALQIINKSVGVFTEEDEGLARAVAAQAALGIENINLFRELVGSHRRVNQLLALATLAGQASDRVELGVLVAERVARTLRCEQARLYYVEGEGQTLWFAAAPAESEERHLLEADACLAGRIATSGESMNVRDAYDDAAYDPAWDRGRAFPVRNALGVPVRDPHGRLVAVLECVNRTDGVFDGADERLMKALAAQLGVARRLTADG
jgi:GAF domain-containing protein